MCGGKSLFDQWRLIVKSLQWRHNERDGVSNYQPHDWLFNRLFRRISKKTSKLRVTGLCVGNSPVTGEFPTQRASNAENVPIWWRHHVICVPLVPKLSNLQQKNSTDQYSHGARWLYFFTSRIPVNGPRSHCDVTGRIVTWWRHQMETFSA